MMTMQFVDKAVSYDTFINDLAARMLSMMKQQRQDPERISQNQAYKIFGRANVERWLRQGRLTANKRPGKVEYQMSELRQLQSIQQDYL